jgi:hypothetical protein
MIVIIAGKAINPANVTAVTASGPEIQVSLASGKALFLEEKKVREQLYHPDQNVLEGVVQLLNSGLADDAYRIGLAINKDSY